MIAFWGSEWCSALKCVGRWWWGGGVLCSGSAVQRSAAAVSLLNPPAVPATQPSPGHSGDLTQCVSVGFETSHPALPFGQKQEQGRPRTRHCCFDPHPFCLCSALLPTTTHRLLPAGIPHATIRVRPSARPSQQLLPSPLPEPKRQAPSLVAAIISLEALGCPLLLPARLLKDPSRRRSPTTLRSLLPSPDPSPPAAPFSIPDTRRSLSRRQSPASPSLASPIARQRPRPNHAPERWTANGTPLPSSSWRSWAREHMPR